VSNAITELVFMFALAPFDPDSRFHGCGYVLKPTSFLFRWASYWMAQAFSGSICCSFFHILCHFGPCTSPFHVHYLLMAVHHLGAIHRLYEYGICVIEIRLASLGLSKGKPTPAKRVQMCDCVILVGFFHSPLLPFPITIKA